MGNSKYGTSGGVELTEELIERLAGEAEEGYDVERLRPRSSHGRPPTPPSNELGRRARQTELLPRATRVPSTYIAVLLVVVVATLGAMAIAFILGTPEAHIIALVAVAGVAAALTVARVVRFWLYLRYLRYIVDQAARQGALIDPVAVIEASAASGLGGIVLRTPWRSRRTGRRR